MKKTILLSSITAMLYGPATFGQGGNPGNGSVAGSFLGFNGTGVSQPLQIRNNFNQAINIFTNNVHRAQFTTGNALTSIFANNGDGLRLIDPNGGTSHLDLFASNNNGASETHVVWGLSGQISGQASRFEQYAKLEGFFFNTTDGSGRYKFAVSGTVTAFVGQNKFWRIGEQADASNFSGARRLEVLDNVAQFRLTFGNANTTGGLNTDFFSNSFGNLQIQPVNGKVGIALNTDPTATIDVNGDARIRNVPTATPNSILIGVNASSSSDLNVRRLDFTGNTNQVLLGNGTWGSYNQSNGFFGCSNSTTAANLSENSRINLNNYNLYFEKNDALGTNHVGIGYSCSEILKGKLSVRQVHPATMTISNTETIAGYFLNSDQSQTFSTQFVSVRGESLGMNMNDGSRNVGGYFSANNGLQSVGVVGTGLGGKYSVGVYGEALNGTVVNYGVYGKATGTNAWAGWFDGPGFLGAGAWTYSDYNLKQNIQEFNEANAILSQLNPVRYDFKTTEYPQLNLSTTPQIGLIAQELQQVLPDAVRDAQTPAKYDSLGNIIEESVAFKAVSYEKLIPVLVGGHQEQQSKIELLQTENDLLKAQLDELYAKFNQLEACLTNRFPDLCRINQGMIQQNSSEMQQQIIQSIDVNLSSKNSIILNQNVPNPFEESTVISYSIPATVVKAQIHFYDGQGKLINSVEITNRGAGQLNVFAEDLSSGTYTYTLVADGQIVSTKKMVKE